VLEPIAKGSNLTYCSTTDAFGIGWSPTSATGSVCNALNPGSGKPTAASQVYHFLKVTVNGTNVTVTPVNSAGASFDVKSYDFRSDGVNPDPPGAKSLTRSGTKVTVTWTPGDDNVGVVAYDLYRKGPGDPSPVLRGTLDPGLVAFVDKNLVSGAYTYSIRARDQAGNVSATIALGSISVP
jgi:hypothetical protein